MFVDNIKTRHVWCVALVVLEICTVSCLPTLTKDAQGFPYNYQGFPFNYQPEFSGIMPRTAAAKESINDVKNAAVLKLSIDKNGGPEKDSKPTPLAAPITNDQPDITQSVIGQNGKPRATPSLNGQNDGSAGTSENSADQKSYKDLDSYIPEDPLGTVMSTSQPVKHLPGYKLPEGRQADYPAPSGDSSALDESQPDESEPDESSDGVERTHRDRTLPRPKPRPLFPNIFPVKRSQALPLSVRAPDHQSEAQNEPDRDEENHGQNTAYSHPLLHPQDSERDHAYQHDRDTQRRYTPHKNHIPRDIPHDRSHGGPHDHHRPNRYHSDGHRREEFHEVKRGHRRDSYPEGRKERRHPPQQGAPYQREEDNYVENAPYNRPKPDHHSPNQRYREKGNSDPNPPPQLPALAQSPHTGYQEPHSTALQQKGAGYQQQEGPVLPRGGASYQEQQGPELPPVGAGYQEHINNVQPKTDTYPGQDPVALEPQKKKLPPIHLGPLLRDVPNYHGRLFRLPHERAPPKPKHDRNSKPFFGKYPGTCIENGFYYLDQTSMMFCSNGRAYHQPCAPGTSNSGHYEAGRLYHQGEFCDVNSYAKQLQTNGAGGNYVD